MRPVNWTSSRFSTNTETPIDFVYFPTRGAASAITIMEDGSAIEVATIGNEGVVGHSILFADDASTNDIIIQVAGDACGWMPMF